MMLRFPFFDFDGDYNVELHVIAAPEHGITALEAITNVYPGVNMTNPSFRFLLTRHEAGKDRNP